jgi:hypothetical protein
MIALDQANNAVIHTNPAFRENLPANEGSPSGARKEEFMYWSTYIKHFLVSFAILLLSV